MKDEKNNRNDESTDPNQLTLATIKTWFEKALPDETSRRQALALWERISAYIRDHHEEFQSFDVVTAEEQTRKMALRLPQLPGNRILAAFEDITEPEKADEERIKLETRLQQSQKMEAIGRLAGGIAHDFNNILTGILGYAEMIKMSFTSSDLVYAEADEIRKACRRAADLVNQLLAFSRQQVIKPKVVNPNVLILNSEKMLHRLINEDIDFHFKPEKNLWNVKVDPGQFDQVLINLVINARDAMPKGGRLSISTENITLMETRMIGPFSIQPGDFVMIMIADSGSGMSDEIKQHIFEPFFSSKEFGQGTGLGLSTVYGIVQQNQGFIDFQSELGKGSIFKVFFPRTFEKAEDLPEVPAPALLSGHESILLVEDEKIVRKSVSEILEKQGYTLFTAQDGLEALRISTQCRTEIHLLLSDVVMPNMNGQDLYRQLQNNRPTLKALFMSGYTENMITKQGMLDRGTPFIQKPFTIEALSKKVRQVLDE
ncbi:MAG: response regulator [Desulfobacteraceae bacterium]|nr:MAG: response regulator [Desulfobacteraceae bacterium]